MQGGHYFRIRLVPSFQPDRGKLTQSRLHEIPRYHGFLEGEETRNTNMERLLNVISYVTGDPLGVKLF